MTMSLEASIVHLSAMLENLTIEVITLRAAMETLTATAAHEIEARTDKPTIEVLKFGTDEHEKAMTAANLRPASGRSSRADKGTKRVNYPATTFSSCCGAEGRKKSKHDGRCFECR